MIPGEKAEATPPWREAASINNDNSSVGRMISTDLLLILVIVVCPSYFAEEIRRCPACVEVRSSGGMVPLVADSKPVHLATIWLLIPTARARCRQQRTTLTMRTTHKKTMDDAMRMTMTTLS